MSESAYARYRRLFCAALADALGVEAASLATQIKDAEPQHGDLAFAAFGVAKTQKQPPPVVVADLLARLQLRDFTLSAAGPYLNARFAPAFLREAIDEARGMGERFGHSDQGAGKTVVIDYSSPNIAKPIAFHHIRSTVLGHALANLHRACGFKVEGINYLGDWGKQFGLVAVGLTDAGEPGRRDLAHLVEVYIKANARAETDPTYDARAREFFQRMEAQDGDALRLWDELRAASCREFERVYARLGIRFEHWEGESRYQGKMDGVIDEITRTLGTRTDQGALVVDLPYAKGEPPILLKKSDGSTLYVTRDLAAAIDRYERFHFDRALYVVATDQALHFKQLFTVLRGMGKPWAERLVHVNFGRVHGMSTRKGAVVLLTDVLDEAKARALEKVKENEKAGRIAAAGDPEQLAEQIGLGAVVFGDLKNRRASDYTFDWDELLSFEGHTGPYLQYAHARACHILAKAPGAPADYDAARLTLPEEEELVRMVARFPDSVARAVTDHEPSLVARQLLDVAAAFSRWYTLGNQDRAKRVLVEDDALTRAARLALTDAVRITLAAGLTLLGVPLPRGM